MLGSDATTPLRNEVVEHLVDGRNRVGSPTWIDVSKAAQLRGFCWPLLVSRRLWADSVAWESHPVRMKRLGGHGAPDRLWFLLTAAMNAAFRTGGDALRRTFEHRRVPATGMRYRPVPVTVRLATAKLADGRLVLLLMLADECPVPMLQSDDISSPSMVIRRVIQRAVDPVPVPM